MSPETPRSGSQFTEKAAEIANKVATTGFTAEVLVWLEQELEAISKAAEALEKELGTKVPEKPSEPLVTPEKPVKHEYLGDPPVKQGNYKKGTSK